MFMVDLRLIPCGLWVWSKEVTRVDVRDVHGRLSRRAHPFSSQLPNESERTAISSGSIKSPEVDDYVG